MPTLLLINPNTTEAVTSALAEAAQATAPAGAKLFPATARFGAAYISDEASCAVAADAVLDAFQAHRAAHGEPDAVLIGCFGDPGLERLRAVAACPVRGLAEASMAEGHARGRYAIVTGGADWVPILERLAAALGFADRLAGVQALPASGAELAADRPRAVAALHEACQAMLQRHPDLSSIVLGGAALAGWAGEVGRGLPVPLIDSVASGVSAAWQSAGTRLANSHASRPAPHQETAR